MFEANFIKSGKLIPRCLDPTETIFPPEMKRVSVLNRSLVTVPESEKKKALDGRRKARQVHVGSEKNKEANCGTSQVGP